MIETNCTIEHNGHTFAAGGAWITDDRICCYAIQPERHWHDWTFSDWHGNPVGTGRITSMWRTGPYRTQMYSFRIRLTDGHTYHGRGQGNGMIVTGRRAKP